MNDFIVTQATVDDWADIKLVLTRLRGSKFSAHVNASLEEAEGMLLNSRFFTTCGLLLLRWKGVAVGLASMLQINAPKPGVAGVGQQCHAFVHSVYIDPVIAIDDNIVNVPSQAGKAMCDAMEEWAKARGATYIYGNVRMDGNLGALYRKFGWKSEHYVVGKEFKNGQ